MLTINEINRFDQFLNIRHEWNEVLDRSREVRLVMREAQGVGVLIPRASVTYMLVLSTVTAITFAISILL